MDKYNIDGHKMQYHPEWISDWRNKFTVYPLYVEISPVGQCNHRCIFCAVDFMEYKPRKIDKNVLGACIEDLSFGGTKSVMFGGEGEPMLHPDIIDITNFAATKLDVGFTTNGSMMNRDFIVMALPSCTFVKVSVNAGDAETYARIHRVPPEHFERTMDNIYNACERKRALGIRTAIGVQCLLLPENVLSIPALAKRCAEIGVDYLVLKPYSHQVKSFHGDKLTFDYTETINQSMQFATSTTEITARMDTMEAYSAQNRGYSKCHATPYLWAYICSTGDVYACSNYLLDERFNFGNINSSSFYDVWHGDKRKALIESGIDITDCRKCCRMDKCNRYLEDMLNPPPHVNFI